MHDQDPVAEREPAVALAWSESFANASKVETPVFSMWLPTGISAALGLSQKPENELVLGPDGSYPIGLIRRQSGGGAVLLYQGVVCWEAFASIGMIENVYGKDAGIRSAYDFLSMPVVDGLKKIGLSAFRAGISDLSVRAANDAGEIVRKIAGTAQYRRRENVLVHGALLVHADIDEMSRYLSFPSSQPDYRADRSHRDFCISIAELLKTPAGGEDVLMEKVSTSILAAAEAGGWDCKAIPEDPDDETQRLAQLKYRNPEWNWKKVRVQSGKGQ
jgi:Lipoate-protein ligase A